MSVHENTDYHKDAVLQSLKLCEGVEHPDRTLTYQISQANKQLYDINFHILKAIVKVILLCGRQNIALRGHRDDSTSTAANRGNFLAIIELLAEYDPIVNQHLELGKRNKCLSRIILYLLFADIIRKKITQPLRSSSAVFSIIADEVTDHYANKEILSVCLRYMNNDAIKEVLLDFVPLERANGASIAEGIITSLQSNSIDVSKCRGQGYDGASCMSSQ